MKVSKALEQEFLAAYDVYAAGIFRHCLLRVSSRPQAEELTQEVFVRVWEYLSSGEEIRNLKGFFYKVATNLITDYYRMRAQNLEFSLERLLEDRQEPPSSLDDILRYEVHETLAEVERVLSGLKPEYREIVLLRYVEELETEEIAEVLGISFGAVYVRLHRALKALRTKLASIEKASQALKDAKLKEPTLIPVRNLLQKETSS